LEARVGAIFVPDGIFIQMKLHPCETSLDLAIFAAVPDSPSSKAPQGLATETQVQHSMRPSRTRYWVIGFAVILAIIQYIDRVCISQAMPDIARDLKLTDAQKGAVFAAFGLAYALFEIPTGWLGDKIGARRVLVRVVLWWSFFTAATGWRVFWKEHCVQK
jgi:hypothetical protein